jgi:hypothetical protein
VITLSEYYISLGYTPDMWHIGQEHPHLENYALHLLRQLPSSRVLEIGFQAGGFAVPVIMKMQDRPDFLYVGIDNGAYPNAVHPSTIVGYLKQQKVKGEFYFHYGDVKDILTRLAPQRFDMILVDHSKPFYSREFYTIASKGLIAPGGYILFHDVLEKAEAVWRECEVICQAFGFSWQIVEDVPGGLAAVKPGGATLPKVGLGMLFARSQIKVKLIGRSLRQNLRGMLGKVGRKR